MKNKMVVLEHGNMMYYSRELVQLHVPLEIDLLFYTIVLLVSSVLVLLFSAKINDVIKVSGIVRTQTNNSEVKNVISGEIREIYYQPEQFVNKGELLYSLKEDYFVALKVDLENQLVNTQERIVCMNSLLERVDREIFSEKIIEEEKNLFIKAQLDEYIKTLLFLENQIEIVNYRYKKELEQPEILFNQKNVDELLMELKLRQKELDKYKAEFVSGVIQKKKAYELEYEKIEQELLRKENEFSYLEIRASVSGFVQEISSLNVGDYIFANQSVLNIIPDDAKNFRVELSVPTKDIGEIIPKMEVKYRLSAFPFFEYKGAEGKITSIDSDVRQSENGRLFYRVYADIDKTSFVSNQGKEYPLKAGIEVDARIVLEKISVMHFVLRKLDFMQ